MDFGVPSEKIFEWRKTMKESVNVEPKTPKRLMSVWSGDSFSVRNERYLVRYDSSPLAKVREQGRTGMMWVAEDMYNMPTSEISNLSIATYDDSEDNRRYCSSTGSISRRPASMAAEVLAESGGYGSSKGGSGFGSQLVLQTKAVPEGSERDETDNLQLTGGHLSPGENMNGTSTAAGSFYEPHPSSSPKVRKTHKRFRVHQSSPEVLNKAAATIMKSKSNTPISWQSDKQVFPKRRKLGGEL